jgi:hypothetical protein
LWNESCYSYKKGLYDHERRYSGLKGYEADADLGVGCGLPTEYADIKDGNTVLDLGSGAGNDCFIARAEVGEKEKYSVLTFRHK